MEKRILPPEPLRICLSAKIKAYAKIIVLIPLTVLGAFFVLHLVVDINSLRRQREIWAEGKRATGVSLKGSSRFSRFTYKYKLTISYMDDRMIYRTASKEYTSLFKSFSTNNAPVVKYKSNDGNDIALSWAVDTLPYQWAHSILLIVIFSFLFSLLVMGLKWSITAYKALLAAANSYSEVILFIDNIVKNGYNWKFVCSSEEHNLKHEFEVDSRRFKPLYLNNAGTKMLAIQSYYNGKWYLWEIRNDFYPFTLSKLEQEQVMHRLIHLGDDRGVTGS